MKSIFNGYVRLFKIIISYTLSIMIITSTVYVLMLALVYFFT